jgi:hypothetical protein
VTGVDLALFRSRGSKVFLTSARTGENVEALFAELVRLLLALRSAA